MQGKGAFKIGFPLIRPEPPLRWFDKDALVKMSTFS